MKQLLILLAIACLALTPAERNIVTDAKKHLDAAKAENIQAWDSAQSAWNTAAEADAHAKQTDAEAATVRQQIEVAHKNEQALATSNAKMKPVYEQCTKWWGIGAILYGFGQLAKHLLILLAVLVVLAVAVLVLSFFFPAMGPFIRMVGTFFGAVFNRITSIFKKKK
jgi:hypothetical protein